MKKIYHLSTCSTCQRIIKELQPLSDFELHDIKTAPITPSQLEQMHSLSKSYEDLFSKRAVLYRERNLKEQNLSEEDIKALILEQYTFLKRPVIIVDDQIFIGNSKKVVEAAKTAIHP
ncbi:arsenate reductase family protein [Maribacter sp. 1_MG-2023]|uniref:arsenate reductase family protein n=1 Tax=Maribacter sp. 1_MG-2023 TaxID=3062677 RepID=UPI0026E2203D|nr:ArsC/Spx/MgsR family protein [Maribacter sp. 1_MG-2023]MDO6471248.1 ArsC/Spx/MgsR family protein [Maribacter sp. 1_MG-2023]